MNRPRKNPYQGMFLGKFAQMYQEMQSCPPEDLVTANFNAIQALLAWEMSDQREFEGEKRTLAAAIEVLVEQEQISDSFAEYAKMLLRGWTLERLANITGQAQNLPLTAARLRADGDLAAQVNILQEFLVNTLSMVDNRELRAYGMQTIQRLKLESGLSQESMDRMLALIEAGVEPDEEDEPGDDGEAEEPAFDAVDGDLDSDEDYVVTGDSEGSEAVPNELEDYWLDEDDSQEGED